MSSGGNPGEDRVLTVPNGISVARLLCVPVFLWLLFGEERPVAAAILLAVLGATDWIDGFIARRFNQVSTLGKILDPLADRLLLGTVVIAMLVDGSVPALVAWPVIVREVLVSGAVLLLAALGARRIDVSFAGKSGTLALMVAFPLFLLGSADDFPLHDWATGLGWCFAICGLAFGYYALWTYVPAAREALREGRAAKGPQAAGMVEP